MNKHSYTQGERRFIIYQYLLRNTCYDQVASKREITDLLKNKYHIEITDPTFYSDITTLRGDVYGLDIQFDPTKNKGAGGYYVDNPPFEPKDIRLLIDCIQSSNFISQKIAKELTTKVKGLSCANSGVSLDRPAFVMNRVHTMEESSLENADKIHAAIALNKQISFRYFHRVPNKLNPKQFTKDGGKIIASPFALIWDNGNYYLYAFLSDNSVFRTFRVDRMDKITVLFEQDREGSKLYREKDLLHKEVKVFDMYRAPKDEYDVSFRCLNLIADAVVDTFGTDLIMIPDGDKHFKFKANIEVSPPFFAWVSTFGRRIQITSPAEVVQKYKEFLNKSLTMYKDDGEKI